MVGLFATLTKAVFVYLCICIFVYLYICVFVYLCICIFMYLCICVFKKRACPFLICICVSFSAPWPHVNSTRATQFCMQLQKCPLHNNVRATVHQIFIALCILCIYSVIISKQNLRALYTKPNIKGGDHFLLRHNFKA